MSVKETRRKLKNVAECRNVTAAANVDDWNHFFHQCCSVSSKPPKVWTLVLEQKAGRYAGPVLNSTRSLSVLVFSSPHGHSGPCHFRLQRPFVDSLHYFPVNPFGSGSQRMVRMKLLHEAEFAPVCFWFLVEALEVHCVGFNWDLLAEMKRIVLSMCYYCYINCL